jgi:two-component system, chemotaxis family, CheB/CheR fusion protein
LNLVGYHELLADVRSVLETLVPTKVEVRTDEGGRYLLSIRPYRTVDNVIEGAVITFTEVTEIKGATNGAPSIRGSASSTGER